MTRRLLPVATALALAGCTVGPNYMAQRAALPDRFAGPQWTGPAPEVDLARWWTAFDDPELQRLVAIGMERAPDLQTAASRVRQARYQIVAARAAGLPELDGAANGQYMKFKNVGGGGDIGDLLGRFNQSGAGGAGTGGTTTTTQGGFPDSLKLVSAGFDATWMVDLFGGVRRQVEEARYREQAAVWNQRAARVMLAGEIASDYFQMRSYQAQARIAGAEADRQARSLSIIEHISQVGLVPQGNASRQRTNLATARAQVAPLEAEALTQAHAIAALVGETPEALLPELTVPRPLPPVPPVVPPGLPADLIRRRPDVAAAERQLAAATAEIGVNVARLYPQLNLTAMPQFAGIWLGNFFLGKTLQLSAQGALSFPILDWGRRRAQVHVAEEAREQAYVQWRQAVLAALRDVEDALVRYEGERRANGELTGGVADARRSLGVNEAQFRTGIQNLQPVLDSQNQLLQIENAKAQSDARLRQAVASLYLALGGGWSDADPDPVRPTIVDAPKDRGKGKAKAG